MSEAQQRASAHEHQADEAFILDPPHLWLIDKLGGDPRSGKCQCPAHDDTNPSLSIGPGTKQPVLLKCHAGCTFEQITAKLRGMGLWPVPEGESAAPAERPQRSDEERKRYALAINNDTEKNHGYENAHLLQGYFAARGIDKVPETAMLALPFPYVEEEMLLPAWGAAMVFPVVDKRNKEIGTHTTWLNGDLIDKREREPKRKFFGPIRGGHVKLFEGKIADLDPQQPIVVAEGTETAAAMGQLTGYPAISLLSASNMRDHVELPARPGGYIVGADNHANGSGLKAAAGFALRHATAECPVRIAMPGKPEGADDGFDWNDALRQADADPTELKRAIRKAPRFDPDQYNRQERRSDEEEALLEELAQLAPLEYARRREAAAQQLGIGVKFLDDEIKRRGAQVVADAAMDNALQAPEPWPERVNGARVLAGLCSILDRHIVLPKGCNVAIALWILHAHAHDAARHSAILYINSPTKRCGKTQLLETMSRLVPKPLSAANVTPATTFRAIDRWHPTMLIDETDTFLSDKSDLRGILNSGHTRSQAYVVRCVGDDFVPKQFSTWAPKAFAAIGRMHPTLEDRSILIELRRKLKSDQVTRIPSDPNAYSNLLRQCARWAIDHMQELQAANPVLPEELNDRARDNWEPLMAIAEACGGRWPERARDAAMQLSGIDDDDEEWGIVLLKDLKVLFAEGQSRSSQDIAQQLGGMDDRPWPDLHQGKPITTRGIAKLLKPFKISPRQVIVRGNRVNGYSPKQFERAFKHYLQ